MKKSVLYVDDEMDNVLVFEATFEEDFDICHATSGEEALALLAKHAFPVVISDQRMPGMSGAELFQIMHKKHPLCKRVMLTGYADSAAMLSAINQGQVYYFVKKPWERDVLFSVILRAVEAYEMAVANLALTDRLVTADRCAMLGRSAARIVHEMSNQLCMLPLLELIEEKYARCEDLMSTAAFTREAYGRLVGLVDELKAFVRFEQQGFSRQDVSLAELVVELVDFLRYDKTLPRERVLVKIASEPIIRANKVKLQQVLVNLLKNAAHAIRDRADGEIALTVNVEQSTAVVSVADNGHGMTAETAAKIWEPFFTTKGSEGNGLGLDIAKAVVEGHGGQISCVSTPGEGATFTIRLPLASSAMPAPTVMDLAGDGICAPPASVGTT